MNINLQLLNINQQFININLQLMNINLQLININLQIILHFKKKLNTSVLHIYFHIFMLLNDETDKY